MPRAPSLLGESKEDMELCYIIVLEVPFSASCSKEPSSALERLLSLLFAYE